MPQMNAGPIFLVGAARSGTTLLQYMLRSHPDISIPTGESHFFIPYYRRRDEFGDLNESSNLRRLLHDIYHARSTFFDEELHGTRLDPDRFTKLLHAQGVNSVPAVISAIFALNAAGEGKARWGDKTPYYILHLDTLLEMFPDAQFIHIVRDGRDCALSMLERKRDLHIFNTYHAAYLWQRYVAHGALFGRANPDIYKEIKYEDLLSQPENMVKDVCDFLHIEYSDAVINFKKSGGKGKTPLLTKPLQKDNMEKWRTRMSSHQIKVFENVAGDMLRAKGYKCEHKQASLWPFEETAYNLHIRASYAIGKLR